MSLTDDVVATVWEPPLMLVSPRTVSVAPTEKRRMKLAVLLSDEEEADDDDEEGGVGL
jgi:hypothetical protein